MKTKLLLLLLLAFSFGNAQFNVSEGFESGAIPTGWTTDLTDGVVTSTRSCGGTKSVRANYYVNAATSIYTSSYVSNGQPINISFYASKEVGSFFGYKYLYYEINGSGTWTQIASVYSDFSTCIPVNATISAGVIPNGATVKFRMQVNRASAANNTYVYFDNFSAVQLVPEVIAEYNFNNTYNNLLGNTPFSSNTGTSFTTDRNGNPNSALQLNSAVSVASIANLPIGNASRSVSIWVKMNGYVTNNFLFSYGSPDDNQAYGIALTPSIINNFAWANDLTSATSIPLNTWKHLVVTFDTTTDLASIYLDGVLITSVAKPDWNTANQTDFYLGGLIDYSFTFNGSIDDLKICNYALSPTEVSNLFNYNQIENPTPPVISNVSETPATSTVTINYTLNTTNSSATSLIKYGLTDTSLTSQINGFSTNDTATNSITINGLQPNTTYYYQIEATNNDGTTLGSIESFTTLTGQTIAEYSFDNTYNNLLGNSPFTSNSGSSFVNDRNGNPNAAINLTNAGIEASIPTLPFNGSSRTISLWAKLNTIQSYNHTFSYGGIFTGLGFAGSFNETGVDFFGYSDDFNVLSANTVSTWYHFVYAYDGINVKVYKNGVLLGSTPKNLNTAVYDIFSLGRGLDYSSIFSGAIDDLKIYNYALSETEITNLFTNNSLSSQDFNQNNLEVSLYPNPVKDILNIETALEIQSVEIYTIQGQKVASSTEKQINVSHLASGIYLVKTQDSNNKISTNKIIIQ